MQKRIIILFIDAFSHSYLNTSDTPFLSSNKIYPLTPVLGFKQLNAAFGGGNPFATGFFTEYNYSPEQSQYKLLRFLPTTILSALDHYRTLINGAFRYLLPPRTSMSPLIPLETTHLFYRDSRPYHYHVPLMRLLRDKGIGHRLVFAPSVKTNADAYLLLKRLLIENLATDFLLIHFPSLDPITHASGINSPAVRELAAHTDWMVMKISELIQDDILIVFSDHGMTDVKGTINLLDTTRKAGLIGKDFICFFDSTMARFWAFNDYTSESLANILTQETRGQLIPLANRTMRKQFGDLLFVASPGYIIYPNYYDKNPPRAMHGYHIPLASASTLNGIFFSQNLSDLALPDQLSMLDLYPVIKKSLENIDRLVE